MAWIGIFTTDDGFQEPLDDATSHARIADWSSRAGGSTLRASAGIAAHSRTNRTDTPPFGASTTHGDLPPPDATRQQTISVRTRFFTIHFGAW